MTEETRRACGEAVRARLQHDDQGTWFGCPDLDPIAKEVEWRAQGANHGRGFPRTAKNPRAIAHRVVLAYHLAEVARCGKVVVQPAVDNQEHLSPRYLAIDYTRDENTGLTDEIATEFDDELDITKLAPRTLRELFEVLADWMKVEGSFAREVRNPETAAQI